MDAERPRESVDEIAEVRRLALHGGGSDGGHYDDCRAGGERGRCRVVAEEHALDLVGWRP